MKRFYKTASVQASKVGDGYQVFLDDRVLKSPARADLILPTDALAEAIAEEWRGQEEQIQPASMPMMTLAATAVDRVAPKRDAVAAEAAAYAGSDLLCYRADLQAELAAAQAAGWDPVLDWAQERFGASFIITSGVMPVVQANTTLMLLAREAAGLDPFRLAALHTMTAAMGSFVLALAVREKQVAPDAAVVLSQIDEDHQATLWGRDEEAVERRARVEEDVLSASRFLDLLES